MGVSTFTTGIDRGTALCVLPDGTVVVASRDGELTRYDATGNPIDGAAVVAAATGLAAHPAGDGVLAAVDGQGLYEVRFGPAAATNEVARLTTISGVAVDVASGSALLTATGPGRLVRVRLDGSGKKFVVTSDLDHRGWSSQGPAPRTRTRCREARRWLCSVSCCLAARSTP